MADGKKRVRRPNTVKGTRRGSKWDERTRTAAMCDLLVGNNISAVARKYGVPESTLRTWLTAARKKTDDQKQSLFEQARAEQLRALNHMAAAGARASVEYIRRRLESAERDAAIYEGARQRLDEADGVTVTGDGAAPAGPGAALAAYGCDQGMSGEEREKLAAAMARHKPMGDFEAANYLRALTSVTGRSAELLGEDDQTDHELRVRVELF